MDSTGVDPVNVMPVSTHLWPSVHTIVILMCSDETYPPSAKTALQSRSAKTVPPSAKSGQPKSPRPPTRRKQSSSQPAPRAKTGPLQFVSTSLSQPEVCNLMPNLRLGISKPLTGSDQSKWRKVLGKPVNRPFDYSLGPASYAVTTSQGVSPVCAPNPFNVPIAAVLQGTTLGSTPKGCTLVLTMLVVVCPLAVLAPVRGCRGLMVKASGWQSFDHQFKPYPRAIKVAGALVVQPWMPFRI